MSGKQLPTRHNIAIDTDTDSDDSDNTHPENLINEKVSIVTVDILNPHTNNVIMFRVGTDVYILTPYKLTGEENQIQFLIKQTDQTRQTVTSSENICLVKCKSNDICIYYIPKLFTRSMKEVVSIVDIKYMKITHNKSGILFDEYTILTTINVSKECKIISTDGSTISCKGIKNCGERCRHISLNGMYRGFPLKQFWSDNITRFNQSLQECLELLDKIISCREYIQRDIKQKLDELSHDSANRYASLTVYVLKVLESPITHIVGQVSNYFNSKAYKQKMTKLIEEDETRINKLSDVLIKQRETLTYVPENIKQFLIEYWKLAGLLKPDYVETTMSFARIKGYIVAFFSMFFQIDQSELKDTLNNINETFEDDLPKLLKIREQFKDSPRL